MDRLHQIAIAGTSKAPDLKPVTGTPADSLVSGVTAEKEWILLQQAGAAAVYRLAGAKPKSSKEKPSPAPTESRKPCPAPVTRLVQAMLGGEHREILPEAVQLIEEQKWRLPFSVLPAVLEHTPVSVRPSMRHLLGERGRWISQFEPGWSWAFHPDIPEELPGNAVKLWEEGSVTERKSILTLARRLAPAEARSWVEESFPKEKADHRAAFISLLEPGLSMEDEPFLEKALDDRSSTVREEASKLLCRLCESRLSDRMIERASHVLRVAADKPGKILAKVKSAPGSDDFSLEIEPPHDIDKLWERDGIPAKPPQGTGKRAFWLGELVSKIPPEHWEKQWRRTPQEILRAFQKSEWKDALIDSVHTAVLRFRAVSWAVLFFDLELKKSKRGSSFGDVKELARLVPAKGLEEKLMSQLAEPDGISEACVAALDVLAGPWSLSLSRHYLQALRKLEARIAQQQKIQGSWYWTQSSAATKISPLVIPEALVPWYHPESGSDSSYLTHDWVRFVDTFVETLRFRQDMIKEIETWQT